VLAVLIVTALAGHAQPLLGAMAPAPASPHAVVQVASLPADAPAEPVSVALDLEWGAAGGLAKLSPPPPARLGAPPAFGDYHSGFPDGVDRPPRPIS
jgi:hypothetical protein